MYILTYMLALTQETLPVFATIVAIPMGTHRLMLSPDASLLCSTNYVASDNQVQSTLFCF